MFTTVAKKTSKIYSVFHLYSLYKDLLGTIRAGSAFEEVLFWSYGISVTTASVVDGLSGCWAKLAMDSRLIGGSWPNLLIACCAMIRWILACNWVKTLKFGLEVTGSLGSVLIGPVDGQQVVLVLEVLLVALADHFLRRHPRDGRRRQLDWLGPFAVHSRPGAARPRWGVRSSAPSARSSTATRTQCWTASSAAGRGHSKTDDLSNPKKRHSWLVESFTHRMALDWHVTNCARVWRFRHWWFRRLTQRGARSSFLGAVILEPDLWNIRIEH